MHATLCRRLKRYPLTTAYYTHYTAILRTILHLEHRDDEQGVIRSSAVQLYTVYTSNEVPMTSSRSHLEKSGNWREWNRCGRSSPKNTMSGFTTPWTMDNIYHVTTHMHSVHSCTRWTCNCIIVPVHAHCIVQLIYMYMYMYTCTCTFIYTYVLGSLVLTLQYLCLHFGIWSLKMALCIKCQSHHTCRDNILIRHAHSHLHTHVQCT